MASNRAWVVTRVKSNTLTEAKNKATVDLLEETGEHGDFLWERFREEVGVKPYVQ